MQLQGMDDQTFEEIIIATEDIQYLLVKLSKMATKSLIENVLIERYRLNRSDAHTFTNIVESRNNRNWRVLQRGLAWVAKRDEPQLSDYLEIGELLNV